MMTPFDKLASLPNVETMLKSDRRLATLQAEALAISDSAAAHALNRAKAALFEEILKPRKSA
jgi:hypothetical protein